MIKAHAYFKVLDATTTQILREMRRDSLPVKIWLSGADKEYCIKYRIRDIELIEHPETDRNVGCYLWDLHNGAVTPHFDGLQHLPARIDEIGDKFICIDNSAPSRGFIAIFLDCFHKSNFPNSFYRVLTFDNYDSLKKHVDSLPDIFELNGNPAFKRTNMVYQGQTVYQELRHNQYWYLDNLHKNHFEVFDATGKHLGEADLDGNVDSKKRSKNKHLEL